MHQWFESSLAAIRPIWCILNVIFALWPFRVLYGRHYGICPSTKTGALGWCPTLRSNQNVRKCAQHNPYLNDYEGADGPFRIIATIGPASDHVETLAEMMQAGMNIARLNYSHGDFEGKEQMIRNIRQAESDTGLHIGLTIRNIRDLGLHRP